MTDKTIQDANILLKAALSSSTTRKKIYQELEKENFINSAITKPETFRSMCRHINVDKIIHKKSISLTLSSETIIVLRIYSLLAKNDPYFEEKFFSLFDPDLEEEFLFDQSNTPQNNDIQLKKSKNPVINELRRIEASITKNVSYIKSHEQLIDSRLAQNEIRECIRHQELIENLESLNVSFSNNSPRKETTNISDIHEFLYYYSKLLLDNQLKNSPEILLSVWNRFCSEFTNYIPKEKLEKKVFQELKPHSKEEHSAYQIAYINYALFLILTDTINRNIKILKNAENKNSNNTKKLFVKRPGRPYKTQKKESLIKELSQKSENYTEQIDDLENFLNKLNFLKNDYYNTLKKFTSLQNYKAEQKANIVAENAIKEIKNTENKLLSPFYLLLVSIEEIRKQWLILENLKHELTKNTKSFEGYNSNFLLALTMENYSILRTLLNISRELVIQESISNLTNTLTMPYNYFTPFILYRLSAPQSKTQIDENIKKIGESITLFSSKIEADIVFYSDVYKKSLKGQKQPTHIQDRAVKYIFKFWEQKDSKLGRTLVPIITLNPGAGKTFVGTLTIRTYLKSSTQTGYTLLVAPSGLINSWYEELESEGLFVKKIIQRTPEERKIFLKNNKFENGNIYITSYDTLSIDLEDYSEKPSLLIYDELHTVTSFTSEQEIIPKLSNFNSNVPYILGITGTPVQNSFMDHFNTYRFFYHKAWFDKDISDDMKNEVIKYLAENEAYFFGETELTYKKNVLLVPCILSKKMQYNLERMKRFGFSQKEIEQYALSPQTYIDNPKFKECHIDTTLISEKIKFCLSYIKGMPENEQIIIFSEYKAPLMFLEKKLQEININALTLMGDDSVDKAEVFTNSDNKIRVLLTTLKKAGTGLNLQSANHMIILDLWWNPAVIEQALHRIDRKGQKASSINIFIPLYYETAYEATDSIVKEKYYEVSNIDNQYYQTLTTKTKENNDFIDKIVSVRKEFLEKRIENDVYTKNLIHFGKKEIISNSLEVPIIFTDAPKDTAYTIIQEHIKHKKNFTPFFRFNNDIYFSPIERENIGDEIIRDYKEKLYSEVEQKYSEKT
ncbi:MAG: DEAD/DEAH box helicase [Spirochaetales bacterium]|nr:DEAD/DEAH box helicase [Spirochaetales bacterium]MDY5915779.1 DEAD/DEAH box helicase [Treponema sp.]